MKGVYLTEEGKKAIEAKIVELERFNFELEDEKLNGNLEGNVYCLKEILSSATILPVEKGYFEFYYNIEEYPNGVIIIQSEQ